MNVTLSYHCYSAKNWPIQRNFSSLSFYYLLTFFFAFIGISANAQQVPIPPLQEFSANSPNSSQLKESLDFQVNHYKGTMSFSIPLHEVVEKGLRLPITISYNSNSIKPDQPVSWVGLSWNLYAGGTITRKVNSQVDERLSTGYIMSKNTGNSPGGSLLIDNSAFNNVTNSFAVNMDAYNYNWYTWRPGASVDYAPDEYTMCLLGRQVRFYIDRDGKIVSNSKIKFEYQLLPYSGNWVDISSWILTFEDGTRYYFEQKELTRTIAGSNYHYTSDTRAVTGWHLTKVESADGKNKILLSYDQTHTNTSFGWSNPYRSETFHEVITDPLQPTGTGNTML